MEPVGPAPVLDEHGFVVPRNLVSKFRSLQTRGATAGGGGRSATASASARHNWPELLAQAAKKQYRAGGPLPPKFVAAVADGIPTPYRAQAWMLLSGAAHNRDAQPQLYKRLVAASSSLPSISADAIDLDVRRTFPEHARLTSGFCDAMRRVLRAYAKRNPEVGYCQGMNFICASILLFVEREEDAFWLLAHIVEEVLPDHYVQSMIGHTVDRQVLEQLVELYLPALGAHLRTLSLSMPFVTTQWFLCLFVSSLPAETAFRLWDLILCHDTCWTFRACLGLCAAMEEQELLDATDLATAVYVIKTSTRAAFDAAEVIRVAGARFAAVDADAIRKLRRDWRRTTMEAMHAKLRVTELYEAQQQVGTFGVEQARSLLLALRLEGTPAEHEVGEAEVGEALGRVLPGEEAAVVATFLRSTAAVPPSLTADGGSTGDGSVAPRTPEHARETAAPGGTFRAAEVCVGLAVLCDGAVEDRLRICFDAFDEHGRGHLSGGQIVRLLSAIYRTYYKVPPSAAEVLTAAEVMFLNVSKSPARRPRAGGVDDGGVGGDTPGGRDGGERDGTAVPSEVVEEAERATEVSAAAFTMLAASQPTLVQCFATRGSRPLLTPRGVDQRSRIQGGGQHRSHNHHAGSPLDALLPALLPSCLGRGDKVARHQPPPLWGTVGPAASHGPLRDDKRLAPAAGSGGAGPSGLLGLGAALLGSVHAAGRAVVSGTADAFGGMGGALDGALAALDVPLKRNPLGQRLKDADELSMALSEAGLEPPGLRIALGFDCAAYNRSAGRQVFSGKPLHASNTSSLLGPDPNPYQLSIFMLGKAFEAVGIDIATPVRCFCYNTVPPQRSEWPAPPTPAATMSARHTPRPPSASTTATGGDVKTDAQGRQWAAPVVMDGMDGALSYYNALPPHVFRGARGSGAAGGLAQAIQYGALLAAEDAAAGATRTALLLLTPGQGIDVRSAREALSSSSGVPLSVVAIGVGDGPFHELGRLAAAHPANLSVVDFHATTATKFPDRALALEVLRALPEQEEAHAELRANRRGGVST